MSEGCHTNRNNGTYQCKRSGFHYFTLAVISIGNEFRAVLRILYVEAISDACVDFLENFSKFRCGGRLGTKEKGNRQLKQTARLDIPIYMPLSSSRNFYIRRSLMLSR
jgi:hypothetical protein